MSSTETSTYSTIAILCWLSSSKLIIRRARMNKSGLSGDAGRRPLSSTTMSPSRRGTRACPALHLCPCRAMKHARASSSARITKRAENFEVVAPPPTQRAGLPRRVFMTSNFSLILHSL